MLFLIISIIPEQDGPDWEVADLIKKVDINRLDGAVPIPGFHCELGLEWVHPISWEQLGSHLIEK